MSVEALGINKTAFSQINSAMLADGTSILKIYAKLGDEYYEVYGISDLIKGVSPLTFNSNLNDDIVYYKISGTSNGMETAEIDSSSSVTKSPIPLSTGSNFYYGNMTMNTTPGSTTSSFSTAANGCIVTKEPIPVDTSLSYILWVSTVQGFAYNSIVVFWYNSNKVYMSYSTLDTSTTKHYAVCTPPSGAAYCMVMIARPIGMAGTRSYTAPSGTPVPSESSTSYDNCAPALIFNGLMNDSVVTLPSVSDYYDVNNQKSMSLLADDYLYFRRSPPSAIALPITASDIKAVNGYATSAQSTDISAYTSAYLGAPSNLIVFRGYLSTWHQGAIFRLFGTRASTTNIFDTPGVYKICYTWVDAPAIPCRLCINICSGNTILTYMDYPNTYAYGGLEFYADDNANRITSIEIVLYGQPNDVPLCGVTLDVQIYKGDAKFVGMPTKIFVHKSGKDIPWSPAAGNTFPKLSITAGENTLKTIKLDTSSVSTPQASGTIEIGLKERYNWSINSEHDVGEVYTISDFEFEVGTFSTGLVYGDTYVNGYGCDRDTLKTNVDATRPSTTRIRTKKLINTNGYYTITFNTNYKIIIYEFDDNGIFNGVISGGTWCTSGTYHGHAKNIQLQVAKSDDSTISVADAASANITITNTQQSQGDDLNAEAEP